MKLNTRNIVVFLIYLIGFSVLLSIQLGQNLNGREKALLPLYERAIWTYYSFDIRRQLPDQFDWITSSHYQFPDVHEFGSVFTQFIPAFVVKVLFNIPWQVRQHPNMWYVEEADNLNLMMMAIGFLFLSGKIIQLLKLKTKNWALAATLATPWFWCLLFLPKNNQLVFLFWLALSSYLFLEFQINKTRWFNWLILGMSLGFLGVIDSAGYIYFFTYFLALIYSHFFIKKNLPSVRFVALGFLIIFLAYLLNQYEIFGELFLPFMTFNVAFLAAPYEQFRMIKEFFGPRGIVFLFPILIIPFYQMIRLFYRWDNKDPRILFLGSVFFSSVVNILLSIKYGRPDPYSFGSLIAPHLLLVPLLVASFLSDQGKKNWPKFLILFFIAYSAVFILKYAANPNQFQVFYESFDHSFFEPISSKVYIYLKMLNEHFFKAVLIALAWCPLVILVYYLVSKWRHFWNFYILAVVLLFLGMTVTNFVQFNNRESEAASIIKEKNILVGHESHVYYLYSLLEKLNEQEQVSKMRNDRGWLLAINQYRNYLETTILSEYKDQVLENPQLQSKLHEMIFNPAFFETAWLIPKEFE